MSEQGCRLADEAAMMALGGRLAECLVAGMVCHLHGPLGAGKTTLVRGVLRRLGYQDVVRSPTYALVESYRLADFTLYHLDLYRLADAEELEYMGMRDFLAQGAVCLIEWPERGEGFLPGPDLRLTIAYADQGGRRLSAEGLSDRGRRCAQRLMAATV